MPESLRIFVAVFPTEAAQRSAAAAIEAIRRPEDGVSWVRPENLHYTVRFLGDLGEDGAARAAEAAIEAAATHPAFDAALGPLGAFPSPRKARVLWAGLADGGEALSALARSVEQALRTHGFERADRPFAPHLTIGRVRGRDQDWSRVLEAATVEPVRFPVDRVLVVHSRLSPKGSVYTVRAEAPLGPS